MQRTDEDVLRRTGIEPTPAIRKFVEALTVRWPEDEKSVISDDSPWKFPPLMHEATGPALFLNLRFGVGERAAFVMAEMAQERGLVTFDLYMNIMRPAPEAVIDEIYRRWWAETFEMLARLDAQPPQRDSSGRRRARRPRAR